MWPRRALRCATAHWASRWTFASTVALDAVGGDYEGFAAADLRHAGGFALRWIGARIDLAGFRLTEAAPPHALELRDARGARWLLVDKPHALLGAGCSRCPMRTC